jgi:2-polyprenyl-3-methyl-5-hydroxy-6-metoxy-1,4-benzoquinol methylase
VPSGVARLDGGASIYEAEHADVFEAHGNIDYYLDDGTKLAAEAKARFVSRFVTERGTLLDVGASYGHFLAAAGGQFEAFGIELNPTAVGWSRRTLGVSNFLGSVYSLPPELPGRFDVITAWDVIEHLDEPRQALAECRAHLAPGGWLFLSTPDAGAMIARVMGSRWYYQDPVQHVNLFTKTNLSRLLQESGFRVEGSAYFGRQYRIRYVVNRMAYLASDHPGHRVVELLKKLPEAVLQSSVTLKMWDVMGLAARVAE